MVSVISLSLHYDPMQPSTRDVLHVDFACFKLSRLNSRRICLFMQCHQMFEDARLPTIRSRGAKTTKCVACILLEFSKNIQISRRSWLRPRWGLSRTKFSILRLFLLWSASKQFQVWIHQLWNMWNNGCTHMDGSGGNELILHYSRANPYEVWIDIFFCNHFTHLEVHS